MRERILFRKRYFLIFFFRKIFFELSSISLFIQRRIIKASETKRRKCDGKKVNCKRTKKKVLCDNSLN